MVKAWQIGAGAAGVILIAIGVINSNLEKTDQQQEIEAVVNQRMNENNFVNKAYEMIGFCYNTLPNGDPDCNTAFRETLMPMCDQSYQQGKAYEYCSDARYLRYIMSLNLNDLPVVTNEK